MPSTPSATKLAYSWQFNAIGTRWDIASQRELTGDIQRAILQEIEAFDRVYSRFLPDSLIQKLAQEGGSVLFPESAHNLFSFIDELFLVTDGKVSPLVGQALVNAGYDATYSLKEKSQPAQVTRYDDTVRRKGREVMVSEPTVIDIGAIGKGYLVDVVSKRLLQSGHEHFVVDASGDMRVVGVNERVGLENPLDSSEVIGTIALENRSLCASAINRRAWKNWHHVIDPATGRPTQDVIATWVVADSTMVADGLATALFFTSPQTLATKYNYEYLRMMRDGSVEYSSYFEKGLFS